MLGTASTFGPFDSEHPQTLPTQMEAAYYASEFHDDTVSTHLAHYVPRTERGAAGAAGRLGEVLAAVR